MLKQSQRVYILEEFINIKNIALSGISNWLRDTSDDNFNILLSFFNNKQETVDFPYLVNLFTWKNVILHLYWWGGVYPL